jgi:hypothetical protein
MFGQKITNTNEMLQCRILHYAKSAPPKSADLNTVLGCVHPTSLLGSSIIGSLHRKIGQKTAEAHTA